ncbi:MAG TPA: 50S ribosomal protein L4, partial [Polyangia bacterium]
EQKLVIVDQLTFDAPKTKQMAGVLKALGLKSVLVVDKPENGKLTLSVRNLDKAKYLAPEGLNVYDILNYPGLLISKDAVKAVENRILGAIEKAGSASAD